MNTAGLRRWAIPIVIIALSLLAAKFSGIFGPTAEKAVTAPAAVTVTTAAAVYIAKTPKLTLTGSIEGETSVLISPKIAGRIERVAVQDGQRVAAGQELLALESVELTNAVRVNSDTVSRAAANYENIRADYNRYRTLYQQNAVSRQQLDSVETRLKVAETDLSSANAGLSSSQQQYAYASVLAPIPGVVANKSATIGQVVATGQQLMTLESIDQVYAVVNVEQKDMGVITIGLPAEITVDAYPGQVFGGTVQIINPAAAASNRMFRTKILIANGDYRLKPGMFIKAAIVTGGETKVLAVPRSAIFQKQGLYYVYTIDANTIKRRQVETGDVLGDFLEIKAGLAEKSAVITSNIANLKDGDTVTLAR